MEARNIAPLRDVDPDRVEATRHEIETLRGPPETAGLDSNDRVARGVEFVAAPEDACRDGVALDSSPAPGERLLDHEAQELAQAVRGPELRVSEDPVQLGPDRVRVADAAQVRGRQVA